MRLATGTPRFVEASLSSACFAVAAAARSGGPPLVWMLPLPLVAPEFTTFHVSLPLCQTCDGARSSSSATIIRKPVVTP